MADLANALKALYHYLCQNVVGSEENVKTVRLMNIIRDNLHSNNKWTIVTSGSFGEGLQMHGSDLDIMGVWKPIEVLEDTQMYLYPYKRHVTIEMEDTQPGFTQLRLLNSYDSNIFEHCVEIGNGFYFSNLLFKQRFSTDNMQTVHGPCVSDKDGLIDLAYSLHCKLWITPAESWITRSNDSWPRYDVKQAIVKHGVLFVPVGVKGSTQVDLEWRISFSVGEKLLIYSFTHTQLLCSALMKILLKDVIALDVNCKELLCSYFMKTILFWICEELPLSIWKPENLIFCYMRCFRRLTYCVEYKVCPHYFIPENYLFENKIHGKAQETLLNKLYILKSYCWQCILILNALISGLSQETSYSYAISVERLLNSQMLNCDLLCATVYFLLEKVMYMVLSIKSSKIQYLYTFYLSKLCLKSERFMPLRSMSCNKSVYKKYNTYISTLLLNTRHDAVSGWLILSSFFSKRKQYNIALYIIQDSLSKCTPKNLHQYTPFSDIHYELFNLQVFSEITIVQVLKCLLLDSVYFKNAILQPDEIKTEKQHMFPPIVFAHFFFFFFGIIIKKNIRKCWDSLRDLQLNIEENNCISSWTLKGLSYNLLGIFCQLLGEKEAAKQAFMNSIKLFPD